MNLLELIEKEGVREGAACPNVGDTVRVHFKIVEGNKERVQIFEGLVIGRKNGGVRETFTVRKISFGVGVERVFPVHSPRIEKIETIRKGDVRRAKLNYIRDLSGKAATRVKEKKAVKKAPSEKPAKAGDTSKINATNAANATVKPAKSGKKVSDAPVSAEQSVAVVEANLPAIKAEGDKK